MKIFFLIISVFLSSIASATVDTCKDVYVGRLAINKSSGFHSVAFLNGQDEKWGSYWVKLTGWGDAAKKDVMSILLAAKVAGTRVHLTTNDGCGIEVGETVLESVHHSHSNIMNH